MAKDRHALDTCDFSNEQPGATEYDSVIERLYTSLSEQLMQLFDGMVKSATSKLVILESQQYSCDSQEECERQSRERESIRYLLNNSKNIGSAFFITFNEQLNPNIDDSETKELSLVSHEEMEEMVAITTMHANALNDFGESISDLNTRIEYLEIKNTSIFDCKAVSPKGISEAYQKTLNELKMGTEVNLELFKLFDVEVIQKLESMYGSLNQIFIDADIMPEIIHTSHDYDSFEEEEISAETVDYYDAQENAHTDFIPRSQSELNNIVSQFTKGDISIPEEVPELPASFYKDPSVQTIDGKKYYQRKDVVRSLNRLQKKILQQGKNTGLNTSEEIKSSLIDDIGNANSDGIAKEVSVLDERNIDFVGMIFNAITSDKNISDVISELVTLLHVPVIKVALDDDKLFQDQAHPTRKVLNLIPKAGQGVTDTKDKLYGKIEHVVNDILAEHDVDVDSFYKAVDALHNIIHVEEQATANNESEEKRSIIKAHARTVVVSELRKYSVGRRIPKDVKPLILKHWPTLMINRYVKYGNESELWLQSSRLCKLIFELLQPVKHKFQLEQLTNQYEVLIEVVGDELYETKQDRTDIDSQLVILKNVFEKMIDEHAHLLIDEKCLSSEEIDYVVQKEMAEYDAAMAKIREEEESIVDKVARLPTYVKPGAWFEIYNGEDHPVRRLKMSVILIETGNIVFVDRKGIKGIEKDAGEFSEELKNNKSRVIADHSTFDHALGKVFSIMAA
ncbi:MAG: DUF1631 family protein [Pseudomonadota bacterium]